MVKILAYAMVSKDMSSNTYAITMVGCWAAVVVIGVSWILVENSILSEREKAAKQNWQAALRRLNKWREENTDKTLESPQGQWLLRIEVGAYMLYMERKHHGVDVTERAYFAARLALIVDVPYVEQPEM